MQKKSLMLVGIGGCNGTTVVGGILANKLYEFSSILALTME